RPPCRTPMAVPTRRSPVGGPRTGWTRTRLHRVRRRTASGGVLCRPASVGGSARGRGRGADLAGTVRPGEAFSHTADQPPLGGADRVDAVVDGGSGWGRVRPPGRIAGEHPDGRGP